MSNNLIPLPILIIDPLGEIGLALSNILKSDHQMVLVTKKSLNSSSSLIVINYQTHIENIPSDTYSNIFFIPEFPDEVNDYLEGFKQKADLDRCNLILVINRILFENLDLKITENLKVILTDEIFGNLNVNSQINQILSEGKNKKEIKLLAMGLHLLYPIFFEDLITEIIKVSENKKANLFAAFQKGGVTELSIVRVIQKIDPTVKLDFILDTQTYEKLVEKDLIYLLSPTYPLFEKIQNLYGNFPLVKTINLKKENSKKNIKSSKKINLTLPIVLFSLCLVLMPIVLAIISFLASLILFKASITSLFKKDFKNAQNFAKFAYATSSFSQTSSDIFINEINFLPFRFFSLITPVENVLNDTVLAINNIYPISNIDYKTIQNISNNYLFLISNFDQLLSLNILPKNISSPINNFYTNYSNILNVLAVAPNIVGQNGNKTYLVLFENNAELRAGGGFIGSYGLISFKNGSFNDFKVYDVYDADGQLKVHIEPPFYIRRYLPSVHLYLRDSNYDPDFTTDAYEAAFILKQETGISVDGVFSIDENAIESLLKITGPIYLPDYNTTISSSNFFITAENAAEKNFFPGSRSKGNFLKSFFTALESKIQMGGVSYKNLLTNIFDNIENKNILFAFSDSNLQSLFSVNSLSSTLPQLSSNSSSSINDFVGVSESNLGVNKADYYLKRSINYNVKINSDNSISSQVNLNLSNNSTAWPGGDYKVYLNFIVPNNANLTSIYINNIAQKIVPAITDPTVYEKKGFIPPSGLEVNQENGKYEKLIGFLVVVPKGEMDNISVNYNLIQNLDLSSPVISYGLYYYKQPGVGEYPFKLNISYPTSYSLFNSNLKSKDNNIYLTNQISKDKIFNFSFRKD